MSDWNDETDSAFTNHEADDWISKSQLKREAKALVAFAVELANELSKSQINQLPFAEETRRAIADYSAIKANIARKRHAQFMGKCLRKEDESDIERVQKQLQALKQGIDSFCEKMNRTDIQAAVDWHRFAENSELHGLLMAQYQQLEWQQLRQLIRNFKGAKSDSKKQKYAQQLHDYLCQCGVDVELITRD